VPERRCPGGCKVYHFPSSVPWGASIGLPVRTADIITPRTCSADGLDTTSVDRASLSLYSKADVLKRRLLSDPAAGTFPLRWGKTFILLRLINAFRNDTDRREVQLQEIPHFSECVVTSLHRLMNPLIARLLIGDARECAWIRPSFLGSYLNNTGNVAGAVL